MDENNATTEAPQTISINGVDYDPTELQGFIDKGKQTLDLEKQWDTPVDKVWPEYGKTRETLNTTAAERDALKQEIAQFKAKENAGIETPADVKSAREAARQLGLTLNEDLDKAGYIKKDDLEKYFGEYSQRQEAVKSILATADGLEKEIDGTDGRPAFNKKVVLAYANAYNMPDLKAAYEDMNKPQLDAWKASQVNSQKSKGLKTLGTGGIKAPAETKITEDNFSSALHESLYGDN